MSAYNDALSWAAAYCSKSEHCAADVLAKLDKYELSPVETQRLIAYLEQARYARSYAMDQFRFAHWGRLKIAQALRMKRISDQNIQNALEEIPHEEYMQVLRHLLQEKQKKITAKNDYEYTMKLLRFAYGRGFEPEYIRQCINFSDDF